MTLRDELVRQILEKVKFLQGSEIAPDCILWPDQKSEWIDFIPLISGTNLPIYTFGTFNPDRKTGPAAYLLWSLHHGSHQGTPVLYLPGVGNDELRAVDSCPPELHPLASLRYRSSLFIHSNGRDWTIPGWFVSAQGLAASLEDSEQARLLLRSSFRQLLEKELTEIKGTSWSPDNLTSAVVVDPVLTALHWLASQGARTSVQAEHWPAFCAKAKADFGFNPEKDSAMEVATKLAQGHPKLEILWKRFMESPVRHPGLVDVLSKVPVPKPEPDKLFPSDYPRYPQWQADRLKELQTALKALAVLRTPKDIQAKLAELWKAYGNLADTVWTTMGKGSLVQALSHLHQFAQDCQNKPTGSNWDALAEWYASSGCRTDFLALQLMNWKEDLSLHPDLQQLVQTLYLPWLEVMARVAETAYKADPAAFTVHPLPCVGTYHDREVVFFIDALRMDLGIELQSRLVQAGLKAELKTGLTIIPSSTSSAKPAISPIANSLKGGDLAEDEAYPLLDGKICDAATLRKGLVQQGWKILEQPDLASPPGQAWLEESELDTRGHDGTLPSQWDAILDRIVFTVQTLFNKGRTRIRIVTDHGWLLVPLGLPRVNLPPALAKSKGGRAAILKPDSIFPHAPVPWYWDPVQNFNLAPGISTFYQSNYAHGGLSLQELIVPAITVTSDALAISGSGTAVDASLSWKGLRLRIAMDEFPENWKVDLRIHSGDPDSTILGGAKPLGPSVAVENDDWLGKLCQFIILDASGMIVFQKPTITGE